MPPWINEYFKTGTGNMEGGLEHSIILEGMELSETVSIASKRSRCPLQCSPTGQRWDNFNLMATIMIIVITTAMPHQIY